MKKALAVIVFVMLILLSCALFCYADPVRLYGGLFSRDLPAAADRKAGSGSLGDRVESWLGQSGMESADSKSGSAVAELADSITRGLDDDYEKMAAVYDWVTHNVSYDLEKAKDVSAFDSGAEYLLETGSGVCHDYALLTMELLESAGIEATYESGYVLLASGERELHAWNEAVIGEMRFALDTTWGSGLILDEMATFVQKPRRIYLVTPLELKRLQSDPQYKQEVEEEYMRRQALESPLKILPALEYELRTLFGDYRVAGGNAVFEHDRRLDEMARRHASLLADRVLSGEEYNLDSLKDELNGQAGALNIKLAAMFALVKWLNRPGSDRQFLEQVVADQASQLDEPYWQSVEIGAVGRGELVVVVIVYVDYH